MRIFRLLKRKPATRFLIIIFLLWGSTLAAGQTGLPPSAASARKTPFRITIVLFRGCEDACRGFSEYWKNRKIPVSIELLDAAGDVKKISGFVDHVKTTKPDLLVTWGTTVSLEMLGTYDNVDKKKHVTDMPALFMIASTPVGSKLVPNLRSSGRNITGTLYLVELETQLRAAGLYMPFKRVGFIHNTAENNSNVIKTELLALSKKLEFTVVSREVPRDPEGKPDKSSLPQLVEELARNKVDILYMAPDTFLQVNRKTLTNAAVENNLPVLSAGEGPVKDSNALLGVVDRYYTVGQLTASKAEQILIQGVLPQNIPIEAPPGFTLIVNMRVAMSLKRYPPIRVLKIAELVR